MKKVRKGNNSKVSNNFTEAEYACKCDNKDCDGGEVTETLIEAMQKFREKYGKSLMISSGYRCSKHNVSIGGAKMSNHVRGLACDFKDTNGEIDDFCMKNLNVLKDLGLYLEHPDATKGWTHLQVVAPKSGNRVFKP